MASRTFRRFLVVGLLFAAASSVFAQRPGSNERAVQPEPNVQDKADVWTMHVYMKDPRMVVLDVLKQYRRRGVAEMLILQTLDYGKNVMGFTGAELSWTLEDNDAVNRTIEAVGARPYKRYRVYQKNL